MYHAYLNSLVMNEIIFWGNLRNSNKVSLQQKSILRTVLGINPPKYMQTTF